MQNCKSIVAMVFECYFFNQLLHCDVWPTEMTSVLQEVKEVYFPGGRPVSMQNSGLLFTLDQKKTCLRAKFQVHWLWFVFSNEDE